ncbi:hypothetical protein Rhe02_48180 [Rhizocola hellebori]|uniref:Abi-like protein n=1 Tax=Rhizocola hellebori TaxID=1392758 RepID=A0A8J3QA70_9ACTN|nr:hypothetical protein [Rhizocola hellebori]GIH06751.1 hypothetical protein Rhe02_48180 [Rhizocola hellebori]
MSFDDANPHHLHAVRRSLSAPRLAPYDQLAMTHGALGLRLYEWNLEASAACYANLQTVEVCLRNAIHDQLTRRHQARALPGSWLNDPLRLLDPKCRADIASAVARLVQQRKQVTPDAIVAELTFGFWRYLLSKKYEHALWTPAIRHGFPHLRPQQRAELAEPVERLHRLRNRVAHHEPIHLRDLVADHHDMMVVLEAICPHTHSWARRLSLLPEVLYRRPVPRQRAGT